ncbi:MULTISPECIES: DUF2071 domain-containing protein [Chitinophagaceae]
MLSALKSHPFPVEAYFKRSTVLTFALPLAQLETLVPPPLVLDTYDGKWGFVAVAMVDTKDLRPRSFPKWMGTDFFLVGYRIFVRYTNTQGKNLRGLYILKSETDKTSMKILGGLFTHYQYEKITIRKKEQGNTETIDADSFHVSLQYSSDAILPGQSPFPDWKTARRYAGPLPFTFSIDGRKEKIITVQGIRENWTPQPIEVLDYHFDFLKTQPFENARLANAFVINDVPYHWEKGKAESWKS